MSDMQNDATAQTNFGRSEQKRHTVLQSAEELFLTRGFNGTSMDEVAVHAGVSKQTVYNQFASKASLFVEIVQSMTARAAKRVQTEMLLRAAAARRGTGVAGACRVDEWAIDRSIRGD